MMEKEKSYTLRRRISGGRGRSRRRGRDIHPFLDLARFVVGTVVRQRLDAG